MNEELAAKQSDQLRFCTMKFECYKSLERYRTYFRLIDLWLVDNGTRRQYLVFAGESADVQLRSTTAHSRVHTQDGKI